VGFIAVWIGYFGVILVVAGLWNEPEQVDSASPSKQSRIRYLTLQLLAGLGVIYGGWPWVSGIFIHHMSPLYIFETYILNPFGHNLTLILWLVACVATISKKRWGPRILLITSLWRLTLELISLPSLISYFRVIFIFDYRVIKAFLKWHGLWFGHIALLIALVVVSTIITRKRPVARGVSSFPNRFSHISSKGRYLCAAILLVLIALGLQWVNTMTWWELDFARTLSFIIAVILVMTGQLLFRGQVLVTSAIALPVMLLSLGYYEEELSSFSRGQMIDHIKIWSPLILLGLIAVFRKNLTKRLRATVLIVPMMLMFLAYIVPVEKMTWCAPVYSKPFPKHLEPPEGARLLSYEPTYDPPHFLGVNFEVNEPYPAKETLAFLSKQFESTGFSKLDYELRFPTIPSSHLEGWFVRKDVSLENPSPEDFVRWEGYWIRETDNIILKAVLLCYDQKTQVYIESSHPVGWSRRAIKLRHQIQFYKQIRNKTNGEKMPGTSQ
jgi:hypothetical protein